MERKALAAELRFALHHQTERTIDDFYFDMGSIPHYLLQSMNDDDVIFHLGREQFLGDFWVPPARIEEIVRQSASAEDFIDRMANETKLVVQQMTVNIDVDGLRGTICYVGKDDGGEQYKFHFNNESGEDIDTIDLPERIENTIFEKMQESKDKTQFTR